MADPFYITTAISYPNGPPHIGHAYEAIAADVIARFHRACGREVRFQTGTDEHGLKMAQKARDLGKTPGELASEMSALFRTMCDGLSVGYDRFIRTTEPEHHRASQALWSAMEANGDLYLDRYEGWYSIRDEAYYDESELVEGEGGEKLSPQGTPVEWTVEESWFFRLSRYQDRLLALYREHPEFIQPESRRNEVMRFVEGGLRDLSVSRSSFDWGVKVPGHEEHVMYVWVDALTNYLTGIGYPDETEDFSKFWPADLHLIGKDIVRFHAIYWPAFLMSAGVELPKRVYAHGFLFNKGEKMSKSVGNVVDPFALIDAYGLDPVRYFFMREVPFGNDGSYSHEAIVNRINADLANGLGNLAQRSLSMIAKHCEGRVPEHGAFTPEDEALFAETAPALAAAREAMDRQAIHKAIEATFEIAAAADRYIDSQAPWALRKTDPDRMKTVLYVVAETVRRIAILAQPYIPGSAAKLLDLVAAPADARDFASLETRLVPGTELPAPSGVFPRYVDKDAEA